MNEQQEPEEQEEQPEPTAAELSRQIHVLYNQLERLERDAWRAWLKLCEGGERQAVQEAEKQWRQVSDAISMVRIRVKLERI